MSEQEAFERWFYGSKYTQVVIPTAGDLQRGRDAWHAACEWQRARIAELEAELSDTKARCVEWARTKGEILGMYENCQAELSAIKQQEPVAITDDMALAFHLALTDGSVGHEELEEIKKGLKAAFANLHPAPTQEGWRPIESAPKDGSEFVTCNTNQGGVKQLVSWDRLYKQWESKGSTIYLQATYWMPLPAAPKPGDKP